MKFSIFNFQLSIVHNVRDSELPRGAGTAGEVTPIRAASAILLRGEPFEVLLMRRPERSSFVPGAWVFPGGALEDSDRLMAPGELETMRACAARELREETGIHTDPVSMVWTARWITPVGVPKRFDTYFFLARVAEGIEGKADETEAIELSWATPAEALRRHHDGTMSMVFPTIKTLEALAKFDSAEALLESRRGAVIPTTLPVIVTKDGQKAIVLPDEP